MKLTKEIKNRIDAYFGNISPQELYDLSLKYGFKEDIDIAIDNQSFATVDLTFYASILDNSMDKSETDKMATAA
jgi:hypothetical protein